MEVTKQELKKILEKYPKRVEVLDIKLLVPNPWNPNIQDPLIFQSLKKSIERYGWLYFPVVRQYVGQFQIIDGEHRYKAAKQLNFDNIQCLILGDDSLEVSEEDAKVLTQLLNTRGQDDILKRAELFKSLKDSKQEDLFGLLPITKKQIEEELKLLEFDFSQFGDFGKKKEDKDEIANICSFIFKGENMLRRLHSETNDTQLKILIETFFEWKNKFCEVIQI